MIHYDCLRTDIDDLRNCDLNLQAKACIMARMKSHAIRRVVVLLPGAATSNWRKLEGVMAFAHSRADWEVSVITSDRAADVRKAIRAVRPDGIICALLDDKSMAFIATLDVPTVIAFHPEESPVHLEGAAYVVSDGAQIGRGIARHAYARGYRSFLCVGKRGSPWEKERFDAFGRELAKFNCQAERLDTPYSADALLRALETLPPRSAVFAADDNVAVEVLNLARRNGIDVPRRFGVIGVSDLTVQCDNSHPPLTSLDQNFAHGGYLAAQRLDTLLRGGIVPEVSTYSPGEVHERKSLPPVQTGHSLAVDLATAFIGRNVRQPIEVPDVVRAAGVSRRQLEKLFAKELSTTVAASIRSMRLEHLAEQLRKSAASASEICRDCGWPHPAHAMRLFKKRFKTTMSEFRR